MNKQRILELADFIEALPAKRFDMSSYFTFDGVDNRHRVSDVVDKTATEHMHTCGTAGCIAGWAVALFAKKNDYFPRNDVEFAAAQLLDLSAGQESRLFFGVLPGMNGLYTTQEQAVNAIRNLANGSFEL